MISEEEKKLLYIMDDEKEVSMSTIIKLLESDTIGRPTSKKAKKKNDKDESSHKQIQMANNK